MDNVFVIGDVHGNLDRLEALLKQEGLLERCDHCDGAGVLQGDCRHPYQHEYMCTCPEEDCLNCMGIGIVRAKTDVTIVQVGDLGHWGQGGSPTGDTLCYKYVTENRWADVVLWGNHDRAMVDNQHAFNGFIPDYQTAHFLSILQEEGRLQTAFEAHGFLITHAGLALSFRDQKVSDELKTDLTKFVDWINDEDDKYLAQPVKSRDISVLDKQAMGIINAIGARRGGWSSVGGILWRDINEGLYMGWRQIFGHSADHKKHMVRACDAKSHTRNLDGQYGCSYCIDIGGKPGRVSEHGYNPNCLAGIWLPSEKIVRVDL